MTAYNFQPQFEAAIVAGIKTSTLRPVGKRPHAQVGGLVQAYCGLRHRDARLLVEAPCTISRPVEVHAAGLVIDGETVTALQPLTDFAHAEGFGPNFGNLLAWFDLMYGLPVLNLRQICWDFAAMTDRPSRANGGLS